MEDSAKHREARRKAKIVAKLIHGMWSFLAVFGAYWLYALVVVPVIEPAATGPEEGAGANRRAGAEGRINSRLAELEQLVPPEARSLLKTPWIAERGDFKLLYQSYDNLQDGRVTIEPCMLIYTPGAAEEAGGEKAPIVLFAPKGATLVFDGPLDLSRGKVVGQPVSGRLHGKITITSPGESGGPEDDLRIVTRDVQLTRERVSTPEAVSFRYGDSFGSGRHLVIKLLHDDERPASADEMPDITGIESFKLVALDSLHLEPSEKKDAPVAKVEAGPAGMETDRPLEITCEGPFSFDPVRQYAKFEDRVDVLRLNPQGQADQLNCELLTLYFSRSRSKLVSLDGKEEKQESDRKAAPRTDLHLREIEARGNPVIVRAFSQDAEARGERLSYDAQREELVLEGGNEVFLRRGPNEIHARSIRYKSKGEGRLGEIFSNGPGRMWGEMPNRPGEQVYVTWNDRLQLEPYEDQHLAILSGGVELTYSGVGKLTAERIDFWLFELPAGPGRENLEVKPDRMRVQSRGDSPHDSRTVAYDRVRIDSPEAFGEVNEMQIWFEETAESKTAVAATEPAAPGESSGTGNSPGEPLSDGVEPRAADEPLERRYEVRGDLAQSRFLIRGGDAELAELMLEGGVRLEEIPLTAGKEKPMRVAGDRVQVFEAHDMARTEVSVLGRPARFEGRGMTMMGSNINVNARTNRLWINGAGRMELPVDRDLRGNALPRPDVLTVDWHKKMDFDGRTARFSEKILAESMGQQLRTESLDVRFTERIRFREVKSEARAQPDLEKLECRGGVVMEGRTYEKRGPNTAVGGTGRFRRVSAPVGGAVPPPRQESWERFEAAQLTINRRTGDIFAQGPGNITTIRLPSSNPLESPQGRPHVPSGENEPGNALSYLYVKFQQMMTGHIGRRTATFHDQVRCVYGEVDSWEARLDPHDPDALDDEGVILTAEDRLTVAESPGGNERSIELEALGNVVAENALYLARAHRVTYSEAKDWLILEGNGHLPAELSFQEYVGGPVKTIPAKKINFRPKTKAVKIDDGQAMQMDGLPMP